MLRGAVWQIQALRFLHAETHAPDNEEHEMPVDQPGRFTPRASRNRLERHRRLIKHVRETTEEVRVRREKEKLAQYFQTVVKNLPGGVTVIECQPDGQLVTEHISEGLRK